MLDTRIVPFFHFFSSFLGLVYRLRMTPFRGFWASHAWMFCFSFNGRKTTMKLIKSWNHMNTYERPLGGVDSSWSPNFKKLRTSILEHINEHFWMVSREHDLQCLFLLVHYHMFLYPIGQHLNQHFNHLWDVFLSDRSVVSRRPWGSPNMSWWSSLHTVWDLVLRKIQSSFWWENDGRDIQCVSMHTL